MARKDRLDDQPFTCSNQRYNTDIDHGEPHATADALGSVFREPLVDNGGYTLWLEHVIDRKHGSRTFWLMWYDRDGSPTIPASGVVSLEQIGEMASRLIAMQ